VQAKPKPVGFEDAVKLYNQSKFAPALAKLNGFIKYGTDNDDVHFYIAACYQGLKQYDKAIKEYDKLAKSTPFISTRKRAENAAYTLKCYRQGVCPGQCLKANDPRWRYDNSPGSDPTKKVIVYFFKGGKKAIDEQMIGHVILTERGKPPVDKGKCPICRGTTRVPQLK
jgi:tetratricopeptide (TPR) repeat protein